MAAERLATWLVDTTCNLRDEKFREVRQQIERVGEVIANRLAELTSVNLREILPIRQALAELMLAVEALVTELTEEMDLKGVDSRDLVEELVSRDQTEEDELTADLADDLLSVVSEVKGVHNVDLVISLWRKLNDTEWPQWKCDLKFLLELVEALETDNDFDRDLVDDEEAVSLLGKCANGLVYLMKRVNPRWEPAPVRLGDDVS